MEFDNIKIIEIKDKDTPHAILTASTELCNELMRIAPIGKTTIAECKTDEAKEAFKAGYRAAIIDYLSARMMGRLTEPEFFNYGN
jgi:hypothetical protein